jgi:hypothetical protein
MNRINHISKSSSTLSNASSISSALPLNLNSNIKVNSKLYHHDVYNESCASQLDDGNINKASGIDYRLNNLEQSFVTFKSEFQLMNETMKKLLETVNYFQSQVESNNGTSVILNSNQVQDIIDTKLTEKIRYDISNNSVLATVRKACYNLNPLSKSEIDSVQSFYSAWNMRTKKFAKNEKSDNDYKQSNALKSHISEMIRMSWTSFGFFNVLNPIQDLQSTGIYTPQRFDIIVLEIAKKIAKILLNDKVILNQMQLPDANRKKIL